MTTTAPSITLAHLVATGKESFLMAQAQGQFFFPKILCAFGDGRPEPLQVAQYEGEFDSLIEALSYLAAEGPIEWLAITSDSYEMTGSLTEYDPLVRSVLAGEQRLQDLFEDEHPSVTEALQVVLVVRNKGSEHASLPYTRRGNKIVWTNPANINTAARSFGQVEQAVSAAIEASHVQA